MSHLTKESKFFKLPPWNHQLDTVNKTLDRRYFALFYDMGTGKSGTVINIARGKFAQSGKMLKTVVLCPLAVVVQFAREWEKFGGELYHSEAVAVVGGTKLAKLKKINKHEGHIYVINHDSLNVKDLWKALWDIDPDVIIVDESHRFKNGMSKKTKALLELVDGKRYEEKVVTVKGEKKKVRRLIETRIPVQFRFILSGTPILNSPMDIWSQYRILDRTIFPENFLVFRGQYMYDENEGFKGRHNYFPSWKPKKDCFHNLNQIIYQHADRVMKSECLDLPPFTRIKHDVELTPQLKKHYREMRDDFVTFLDSNDMNDAMMADLAIVKALRLQQLVCGIFVHDERDEKGRRRVTKIPCNRAKELKALLEDLAPNHKVIVWTIFADTYDDIGQVCSEVLAAMEKAEGKEEGTYKYTMLTGRQSQKEKQDGIDAFQNDPNTRIKIANQAAGGTGVNLTASSYSIYYSRNFNLEHDDQSEARNYRGGSEVHESVTRVDLVTPDTIDEIVLESLAGKANMAASILKKGAI